MREAVREFGDLSEPRNVTLISAVHGVNEFFSIALPPIIPFLVSDLDISYAEAGLLLTVFFAMYSVFQLPAGVLADRVGKKRMMVGGMVCMVGGIALAGAAADYPTLVAAQVVAGIGGSTYHPTGKSLVSDFETRGTEGKAMGVHGFGGTLGTASAPLVIGGIAGLFDWRLALVVAAVLGAAVTTAFVVLFSEPDDAPPARSADGRIKHDGGRAGIVGRLYRGAVDAVRVPLTGRVALLLLMATLVSMQTRAILTFTTSYVFTGTGRTVSVANVVFFVALFAGSFSQLAAGSLADRFDRGGLGVAASLLTAALLVASFVLVEFVEGPGALLLGALLVLFFGIGIAMYASAPVKNALLSQYAEREFSGSLFGVAQTTSSMGSAASPALFGLIATEYGMTVAYPMIAVVSVLIGATFLLLSRGDGRTPTAG